MIRPAAPREQLHVRLPDGRLFEAPLGSTLAEILATAQQGHVPAVAAIINGRLVELGTTLTKDTDVLPVLLTDAIGARIYRRSLIMLLITAVSELYPGTRITVEHAAANTGAFYCRAHGREPFTAQELEVITWRMSEIVVADDPIRKVRVSVDDAVQLFEARGEADTASLLQSRTKPDLSLHELRGHHEYFQGYLVASTGVLQWFALHAYPPGFMLQFPHSDRPSQLGAIAPYPKLFSIYAEHGEWLNRLGVRGVGALNEAIHGDLLPEISLVGEAFHESQIARIAADIAAQRDRVKVILIAGPSSSGKTTTSKRLAVQLLAQGIRPYPIGLDDYFLDRDKTPRDAKGDYDFEALTALDVPLFNQHLLQLMRGEVTQLPHYSFQKGIREPGAEVMLTSDQMIIVEGIHGLNPALVPELPNECVYRVYVSALTQLNLDGHNRVSTSDCRLIRRIVRDAATRGYDARATLKRWDSVNAGEKKHIFPYQEYGDAIFNSALVHELAVLKPFAEPLLLQVRPEHDEWLEANRLLSFLRWFRPGTPDVVPTNSILREFIGGSVLETFDFSLRRAPGR